MVKLDEPVVDRISIHAPARGATTFSQEQELYVTISIHAPARGATDITSIYLEIPPLFQSTLPRGERPDRRTIRSSCRQISIHAPARGATVTSTGPLVSSTVISIHAPARGATVVDFCVILILSLFQSTLPRGERLHGRN